MLDEEEEEEGIDLFVRKPAMDPKTPPFFDLEDKDLEERQESTTTSSMKKQTTRIVIKRTAAAVAAAEIHEMSIRNEELQPLVPMKRKRRMQQFCYSSSDDDLRETVNKEPSRKAVMSSQESEAGTSGDHHKIYHQDELPLGVLQARAGCTGFQIIMAKHRAAAARPPTLESAPVFHPTKEEFQDTLKYIESIRPLVEPYGICRVVPPSSWKPPCSLKDNAEETIRFTTRVQKIHKLQVREPTTKSEKKKGGRQAVSKSLPFAAASQGSVAVPPQEFFGFEPGPAFTINEFEAYAKQLKDSYFHGQQEQQPPKKKLEEPSVETIEGEFWRIVEKPTEQIEVLYGADIETNAFKSGFPKPAPGTASEASLYEKSGWNLNNIARLKGSVLEFEEGEISGVVVPWLYVGMCFSSFCWHVEDHHLYSVNYMHWGSPKVWYGVPGFAASKLEAAMKKRLPKLFNEQPDLLHKLVTQLSPSVLREEGVPVYRVVQHAGEFVITFPRAYHSGFNCGFNCAEAVNVAPINWLPHGQSAVEIYKQQHRKTSISHDKLLLAAVKRAIKPDASEAYVAQKQVLAEALKGRLSTEASRRASVNGLRSKKMDINFDSSDERECCVCSYDLHLSAAGCDSCSDLYSCLDHALDFCKCPFERKFLMYRHELSELDDFVRSLEGRPPVIKLRIGPRPAIDLNTAASCLEASQGLPTVNNNKVSESRSGPRIARVVRPIKASYDVELVRPGRVVLKTGWHTKNVILPAGFKSRVQFYDYLDLPQLCYYFSEVLDCTDGKPLFKVSMESKPGEKFVCSSIDFCWQSVQERVNSEIKRLRESGRSNLPPLRPPESLKGLDMFGFTVPSVVQAVEALDSRHLCEEYWAERIPLFATTTTTTTTRRGLEEQKKESSNCASLKDFLSTEAGKEQLSELQQILSTKLTARGNWLTR